MNLQIVIPWLRVFVTEAVGYIKKKWTSLLSQKVYINMYFTHVVE